MKWKREESGGFEAKCWLALRSKPSKIPSSPSSACLTLNLTLPLHFLLRKPNFLKSYLALKLNLSSPTPSLNIPLHLLLKHWETLEKKKKTPKSQSFLANWEFSLSLMSCCLAWSVMYIGLVSNPFLFYYALALDSSIFYFHVLS